MHPSQLQLFAGLMLGFLVVCGRLNMYNIHALYITYTLYVCMSFSLEIRQAYDVVWQEGILYKLKAKGVQAVLLF